SSVSTGSSWFRKTILTGSTTSFSGSRAPLAAGPRRSSATSLASVCSVCRGSTMDLLPTTDQEEIAAAARSFLAKELPESRIRQLADEEMIVDPPVWSAVAQLGWFALGLPEDLGGVGYGLPEEVMLFREIGRHLAPGPFASTALAARVAARA